MVSLQSYLPIAKRVREPSELVVQREWKTKARTLMMSDKKSRRSNTKALKAKRLGKSKSNRRLPKSPLLYFCFSLDVFYLFLIVKILYTMVTDRVPTISKNPWNIVKLIISLMAIGALHCQIKECLLFQIEIIIEKYN